MPGLAARLRGEPRREDGDDDDIEDCLECRVVGTATCFGVAAYTMSQRVPANRVWLTCFSSVWVAMGFARALIF